MLRSPAWRWAGLCCTSSASLQLLAAWQSQRFAYSCETTADDETAKPWHLVANTVDSTKTLGLRIGVQIFLLSVRCLHLSAVFPRVKSVYGTRDSALRRASVLAADEKLCVSPQHTLQTGIVLMRWSYPVSLSSKQTHGILIMQRNYNTVAAKLKMKFKAWIIKISADTNNRW